MGASASNPYASRLIENLGSGGFGGRLYLINPRQASVGGMPCHPSIDALPETPDLAILVVPQRAVLEVLETCGLHGIPAALIISAGFGEAGEAGQIAQVEIRRIANTRRRRDRAPQGRRAREVDVVSPSTTARAAGSAST